MIQLQDVISALLNELDSAVSTSHRISARLAEEYDKHHILKYLAVPNIDLKDVTIELTLAMKSYDQNSKNGEVILDWESLKNFPTSHLSSVIIKAKSKQLYV